MKTIDTTGSCPYCGKRFDHTSDVESEHVPEPGNITICVGCAGILVFGNNMEIQKPTPDQLEELKSHPAVKRMQSAVLLSRGPGKN